MKNIETLEEELKQLNKVVDRRFKNKTIKKIEINEAVREMCLDIIANDENSYSDEMRKSARFVLTHTYTNEVHRVLH